jgi:hypothetical protein
LQIKDERRTSGMAKRKNTRKEIAKRMAKKKKKKDPWLTQPRATIIAAIIGLISALIVKYF